MPKLVILGSANAIPDEKHDNTHLALAGQERALLVDCGSNPLLKLARVGIALDRLMDLALTHFHPDHVSGVPMLLMNMWLLGRKKPLMIHGLSHTLDRVEGLMEFYDWGTWPNFFRVEFNRLPEKEKAPVVECDEFRVWASPVRHLVPTIGLRIEFLQSGKAAAYSCDTEPCDEVMRLAAGADVLFHEAAGAYPGHSSAIQAGKAARQAEVGALYLIHYPVHKGDPQGLLAEARMTFPGQVALAEDYLTLEF